MVITALTNPEGQLVGFAKVTRDLTERMEAEAERLRLARAEEVERRNQEFLAIMGHELRNPLAPMVTAVHRIRLRGGRNCEQEIALLGRQLTHMTRLVNDLLVRSMAVQRRRWSRSRVTRATWSERVASRRASQCTWSSRSKPLSSPPRWNG